MNTTLLERDFSLTESGEKVYPAVLGEFYSYSPTFTTTRPVYTLLKCKSQKNWPVAFVDELGTECHFVFEFGVSDKISSMKQAHASNMLTGSTAAEVFDETWIAAANISPETFYGIRGEKESRKLVDVCKAACKGKETSTELKAGLVYAVQTNQGKYGLFLATEVGQSSITIDACHILL